MEIRQGEPLPWFVGRTSVNAKFQIHTCAGRYIVLCFFGSASSPKSRRILDDLEANRHRFSDDDICFFGVSIDPDDERQGRIRDHIPGIRYFWDFDRLISQQFGAIPNKVHSTGVAAAYRPFTLIVDERLRVLAMCPFDEHPETHIQRILSYLETLPPIGMPACAAVQAPVLVVPRIFEAELCRKLIDYYDARGGEESGFMRDQNGKTVAVMDYAHKRRKDCEITDGSLRTACMHRIHNRLLPEIHKAFQFQATRMERYIVACYEAATGGHFRPHRDNTTRGTAHRRFAVSLGLNTDFEGGNLRFPEFGRHTYRAPEGGAVVFSCSLLHEATPVTSGRRYVFLPFLYDDAAARIREGNLKYLANTVEPIRSSSGTVPH